MLMFCAFIPEEEPKKRKGWGTFSEAQYFGNTNPKLQSLECPTCHEIGGLFIGINEWILCRNCMNLYVTVEELNHAIEKANKDFIVNGFEGDNDGVL